MVPETVKLAFWFVVPILNLPLEHISPSLAIVTPVLL